MQRDAIATTTVERKAILGMGHMPFFSFFMSEAVFVSSILVGHFTPSDECPLASDSSKIQFPSQMGLLFMFRIPDF